MKDYNLNSEPKLKSGFKIPEDYFVHFENKMATHIPKKEIKTISIFYKKRVWVSSIAAAVLAIIALPFYFEASSTTEFESATLENYITENYTTYEILQNLSEEDLIQLDNTLPVSDKAIESYFEESQNLDYYLEN